MTMKLNPPDLNKCINYESYKNELLAWESATDVDKKKRGVAVALSLPVDHPLDIRSKVFSEIATADLNKDDGLKTLIAFLDQELKKDDLTDAIEKWEDFEEFTRSKDQSITDFISQFEQKHNKLQKKDIKLPPAIVAFKLIKAAKISKEERLMVLSGMNFEEKDQLFVQAKKALRKYMGECGSGGTGMFSGSSGAAIKLEPAFLAEHEEALFAAGYVKSRGRGRGGGRGGGRGDGYGGRHGEGYGGGYGGGRGEGYGGGYGGGRGEGYGGGRGEGYGKGRGGSRGTGTGWRGWRGGRGASGDGGSITTSKQYQRPTNSVGSDGNIMLCFSCGSYRHMQKDCPDSWENIKKVNLSEVSKDNEVYIALYTSHDVVYSCELASEARNCAVLDTACTATVTGKTWLNTYLSSLSEEDLAMVTKKDSNKIFKFGSGDRMKSCGCYTIPAELAGKPITITTDVVNSEIPLLLSLSTMKKARIKLNLEEDAAEVLGRKVCLNYTSSGHYCIPIDKTRNIQASEVLAVQLEKLDDRSRFAALRKLHRQFAHPIKDKFINLLKDSGAWNEEFSQMVEDMYAECEICKVYRKTPARPAVAMPMASQFNQLVAMDLKKWRGRHILHLIDMWSRFSMSAFIDRKYPSQVIDKIMMHWTSVFGFMDGIFHDNGGEFTGNEISEVASVLNIVDLTTGAESPFQNGLCEKIHGVTDLMLMKMEEDNPNTPPDVLLAWATNARNSLQMWNGFSSHQLVFGGNPKLPNIMTAAPPELQGTTTSEVLAKHLNALHSARKAFIKSEADERVRRALRTKMRSAEQRYEHGDIVYYKREDSERWLGPAKVVFQDNKIIFVRHGPTFVRVSANRLIKKGDEFIKPDSTSNGTTNTDKIKEVTETVKAPTLSDVGNQIVEKPSIYEEIGKSKPPVLSVKSNDVISLNKDDVIQYRVNSGDEWKIAKVLNRGGTVRGKNKNWFNVEDEDTKVQSSVNLESVNEWKIVDSEEVNIVLIPRSRHQEEDCVKAKQVELEKLKSFQTYEEVQDIGQARISTTWVLWDKAGEIRARLVARGFEEEEYVPKDSPTISKSTLRTLFVIAVSKSWRVKTTDIKSAFLQGKKLDRKVHIKPPKEANVSKDKLWLLICALYGLNDAAKQFFDSVFELLVNLGCQQSKLDPALFIKRDSSGVLIGCIALHVDDFLHCGTSEFDIIIMDELRKRFLAGKMEEGNFRYVGFDVLQSDEGIILDQSSYLKNIEIPKIDASRLKQKNCPLTTQESTQLRSSVGALNWAVQGSRPDKTFDMVELSTKFCSGVVADLIRACKVLKQIKEDGGFVSFVKLGKPRDWVIFVYTDAALANLSDGVSSMGAYLVLLVDLDRRCSVLNWQGKKIRRVVTSTLEAETLSLQEGIADAIFHRMMIEDILGLPEKSVPIEAVVDNQDTVDAVYSTKAVTSKLLRLNIGVIKDELHKQEISLIRWCDGEMQLANCMTKRRASGLSLLDVIRNGFLNE